MINNTGYNNNGNRNIFFGLNSGFGNLTGDNNIFIGESSGFQNTSGGKNIFIGSGVVITVNYRNSLYIRLRKPSTTEIESNSHLSDVIYLSMV